MHIDIGRGIWLGQPILCIFKACVENSSQLLFCILEPNTICLSNIESGQEKNVFYEKIIKIKIDLRDGITPNPRACDAYPPTPPWGSHDLPV